MINVLIVEDNDQVARMLELTFAMEGYETEHVADGAAALERLDDRSADVVLLDVMMPGCDGLSFLKELRVREDWRGTKVVITSALGSDEDIWRGWTSGADYYLVKPFDLDQLRDVVERLVAGQPVP